MDNMRKSIKLGDTLGWDLNLGLQEIIDMDKLGDSICLDDDLIKFTSENCLDLVKKWSQVSKLYG